MLKPFIVFFIPALCLPCHNIVSVVITTSPFINVNIVILTTLEGQKASKQSTKCLIYTTSGWKTTNSFTNVSDDCQQLCEQVNISTERKCKWARDKLVGSKRRVSANSGTSCSSQVSLAPQREQIVGIFGVSGVLAVLGSGAPRIGGSSLEYL